MMLLGTLRTVSASESKDDGGFEVVTRRLDNPAMGFSFRAMCIVVVSFIVLMIAEALLFAHVGHNDEAPDHTCAFDLADLTGSWE